MKAFGYIKVNQQFGDQTVLNTVKTDVNTISNNN